MKPKKAAAVRSMVKQEFAMQAAGRGYSVITIRFADGRAVDIPYLPWQPRQTLDLPGRWVKDDEE